MPAQAGALQMRRDAAKYVNSPPQDCPSLFGFLARDAVAGTGMGCLRSWVLPGMQPADMQEAHTCFMFIVTLSIPLSVVLV